MKSEFSRNLIEIIKNIPYGKVCTYGQIAALAGNSQGARQVVRLLHTSSEKHSLPWHRVVNSKAEISLKPGNGYELQKSLLEKEGIRFDAKGKIDFKRFLWNPQDQ